MSAPPPLEIAHSVRVSILEKETKWTLRGDTLWLCREEQPEISIPLSALRKLRIAYEPSRARTNLFCTNLYNSGGKCGTIQNSHFEGIANFADRSETYVPFVRALISRVAAVNPSCEFVTGTSYLRWLANAAFLLVTFGFLILAIIFFYTAIGSLVIIKLIIIAFFVPVVIRWFVRNKPRTFTPDAIPEKLLPKLPG